LAALACTLPGAVLFSKSHLREDAGQRRLEIDGVGYAVGRETVGESSIYGIEAAIRVGKLLGVSDAALAGFAAHPL